MMTILLLIILTSLAASSLKQAAAFVPTPHHSSISSKLRRPSHHHPHITQLYSSTITPPSTSSSTNTHIPINESYPGLQKVHTNPNIYIISNFLTPSACNDIITRAKIKGTQRSPVAYAGWTTDMKDLLGLAASGPVSWIAILSAWYEAQGDGENASVVNLVVHALRNYSVLFVMAGIGIAIFTKVRADGLQELRTSTSTTLDDLSSGGSSSSGEISGVREFVLRSSELFQPASSSSSPLQDDDVM